MYRGEKKKRDGDGDRLGGLPEHLILAILCLLPLKSAIATCVLSRRWRFLWMDLPDINISIDKDFGNNKKHTDKFFSIVDNFLTKLTSPFINRISLDLGDFNCPDYRRLFRFNGGKFSYVNSWFDWAEKHKHLHEFSFKISGHESGDLPFDAIPEPPLGLFQTPSLVVLELKPWFFVHQDFRLFTDDAHLLHLPNLKKVTVQIFPWIPKVLEKLVSCSPSLEHLSFEAPSPINPIYKRFYKNTNYTTSVSVSLSSRTLKRLDMNLNQTTMNIILNTPKLEYLDFQTKVLHPDQALCYRVSFVNTPPALVGCSILAQYYSVNDIFMPSNLFSLVSNVISLTINDNKPGPLIAPLTFTRLTHLTLKVRLDREVTLFSGLPLLKQCPLLEVLTLDLTMCSNLSKRTWSLPESTPQCLVTSVKTIQIIASSHTYRLETSLSLLVNYLLGTAQALELLRIHIITPPFCKARYNEQRVINEVFQAPRPYICRSLVKHNSYRLKHHILLRKLFLYAHKTCVGIQEKNLPLKVKSGNCDDPILA